MTPEKLVLSKAALQTQAVLHRDLHHIKVANLHFGLGIEREYLPSESRVSLAWTSLAFPYLDSSLELFYMAIAKQLPRQTRRLIDEDGMPDDRSRCQLMRELGFPERAEIWDEWYNLADSVQIEIITDGSHSHADMANRDEIDADVGRLSERMAAAVAERPLTKEQVETLICDRFGLRLVPIDEFNSYWTDRIVASPGFGTFDPEPDDGESWYLTSTPCGWLTRRHGAALENHGYRYRFAFWAQEIGDMRGHLWIQTNRGPLRLTDGTDAVSLRSNFPVQVSDRAGHPLFQLHENDVPDHLLRTGPEM